MPVKSRATRNSKWTSEAILKAIDVFIVAHNKLPSVKELDKEESLPTHSSIKNRFGMTAYQFYEEYYPEYLNRCDSNVYHYNSPNYWFEDFQKQYIQLGKPTMEEYNRKRDKRTPCVSHLLKILHLGTWNELLVKSNFNVIGQNLYSKYRPERKRYNIHCTFSDDITAEELNQKREVIAEIVRKSAYNG